MYTCISSLLSLPSTLTPISLLWVSARTELNSRCCTGSSPLSVCFIQYVYVNPDILSCLHSTPPDPCCAHVSSLCGSLHLHLYQCPANRCICTISTRFHIMPYVNDCKQAQHHVLNVIRRTQNKTGQRSAFSSLHLLSSFLYITLTIYQALF